jgi:hypothetical protein
LPVDSVGYALGTKLLTIDPVGDALGADILPVDAIGPLLDAHVPAVDAVGLALNTRRPFGAALDTLLLPLDPFRPLGAALDALGSFLALGTRRPFSTAFLTLGSLRTLAGFLALGGSHALRTVARYTLAPLIGSRRASFAATRPLGLLGAGLAALGLGAIAPLALGLARRRSGDRQCGNARGEEKLGHLISPLTG